MNNDQSKQKPPILIIDDQVDVAEVLAAILEDVFECTVITDSVVALALVQRERFAVIITDISMPKVSGIDITKAALELDPDACVLVTTGYSEQDEIVQRAMAAGAKGVMLKPYRSTESILAAVNDVAPIKAVS